jgi:hypothetical protein
MRVHCFRDTDPSRRCRIILCAGLFTGNQRVVALSFAFGRAGEIWARYGTRSNFTMLPILGVFGLARTILAERGRSRKKKCR